MFATIVAFLICGFLLTTEWTSEVGEGISALGTLKKPRTPPLPPPPPSQPQSQDIGTFSQPIVITEVSDAIVSKPQVSLLTSALTTSLSQPPTIKHTSLQAALSQPPRIHGSFDIYSILMWKSRITNFQ
jgi:hypothetical protein